MALVWADGFDHYALGIDMNIAGWQKQFFSPTPYNVGARTGLMSLYFAQGNVAVSRVVPPTKEYIIGAAFFEPHFANNAASQFGHWLYNGTHWYGAVIYNNGSVAFFRDGTLLLQSALGVLVAGTDNYLEFGFLSHATLGTMELRRNGISGPPLLLLTGLNTNGGDIVEYWLGSRPYDTPYNDVEGRRVDDLYINDKNGTDNNDFNGDVRCRTSLTATNGPIQDFALTGAASAHAALSNIPPNNGQYIASSTAGDIANFGKAPLPINTAYIAGVNLFVFATKTDAGACEIEPQLVGSDGIAVANGPSQTIGTGGAYYMAQFDVDPSTGLLFDRVGFDAALSQIERTV